MKYIFISPLLFLFACTDINKCVEFQPYDFEQKLQLVDLSQFSKVEQGLLFSYFEKYRIRIQENSKSINVKDKKFALIQAEFPIVNNFCAAISAEKDFAEKTKKITPSSTTLK